jgi:hypothetical protein
MLLTSYHTGKWPRRTRHSLLAEAEHHDEQNSDGMTGWVPWLAQLQCRCAGLGERLDFLRSWLA